MFKIHRMKSLLALSPSLSNSAAGAAPFSLYIHSRSSCFLRTRTKINPSKNPKLFPAISVINSLANYAKPSNCSQSRGLCTDGRASGEIHVIVGPMFAGKTTTLLKRMKSESSNGRLDGYFRLAFIVLVFSFVCECMPLVSLLI